jgi:hypothetical protein
MKNSLIKACIVILVSSVSLVSASAQIKRPHLLIGANASYNNPQGSFANTYKFGLGGEVFGGIGVGKTYLIATLGTSNFFADKENSYGSLVYKPIKVGVRQFLFSNKIFVTGDMGVGYVKDKTMNNSENKFTAGIGAGARLLGLEAGIYYNSWKALHEPGFSNSVQLKVGWSITL